MGRFSFCWGRRRCSIHRIFEKIVISYLWFISRYWDFFFFSFFCNSFLPTLLLFMYQCYQLSLCLCLLMSNSHLVWVSLLPTFVYVSLLPALCKLTFHWYHISLCLVIANSLLPMLHCYQLTVLMPHLPHCCQLFMLCNYQLSLCFCLIFTKSCL